MKSVPSIATAIAAVLLPALLFAQSSPPVVGPVPQRRLLSPGYQQSAGEPLPDNYQVVLTMTDKDGQPQELSLVSDTTNFSATLGEQDLNFSGTLTVDEGGLIHIHYTLGWETALVNNGSTNYKSTSVTGGARLKSGQEIIVFHTGTKTAKLLVKKLELAKAE